MGSFGDMDAEIPSTVLDFCEIGETEKQSKKRKTIQRRASAVYSNRGKPAASKMEEFSDAELQKFPQLQQLTKEQVRADTVLYDAVTAFRRRCAEKKHRKTRKTEKRNLELN